MNYTSLSLSMNQVCMMKVVIPSFLGLFVLHVFVMKFLHIPPNGRDIPILFKIQSVWKTIIYTKI